MGRKWGGDVAQLAERRTGTPLRQVRFPGTARDFFPPESQLSVQTLFRCPYSPSVQSPAQTSACTLKIPSIGSDTFDLTHVLWPTGILAKGRLVFGFGFRLYCIDKSSSQWAIFFKLAHTHTHTQTHTHTHTNKQTNTHAHKHTHIQYTQTHTEYTHIHTQYTHAHTHSLTPHPPKTQKFCTFISCQSHDYSAFINNIKTKNVTRPLQPLRQNYVDTDTCVLLATTSCHLKIVAVSRKAAWYGVPSNITY